MTENDLLCLMSCSLGIVMMCRVTPGVQRYLPTLDTLFAPLYRFHEQVLHILTARLLNGAVIIYLTAPYYNRLYIYSGVPNKRDGKTCRIRAMVGLYGFTTIIAMCA